ncbi:CoA transferase, partial [Amycolatopsis thailandensis]|uniref:CoA transferase n=1 Tax=Amycolatopsis thailandensis TaxID=589330 RepID=UPI003638AE0E
MRIVPEDREAGMTGSLDGVTVVEVGVFLAAPFATVQLADLGARPANRPTPIPPFE